MNGRNLDSGERRAEEAIEALERLGVEGAMFERTRAGRYYVSVPLEALEKILETLNAARAKKE